MHVLHCFEMFGICALLGHYAASSGNLLLTFWDILSVPSSGSLRMGPIACPETSVRNYRYSLCNDPEERSSQLLRGGSLKSPFEILLKKQVQSTTVLLKM